MQYLKIMKPPILIYGDLWVFITYYCVFPKRVSCVFFLLTKGCNTQKMMMINELPNLLPLVWALVARLVSNGCSSLVHHLPIT